MICVAALDPSIGETQAADYRAWIVLGGVPGKPDRYCLHARLCREGPVEVIQHLFWIEDHFGGGLMGIGIEANGCQRLYRTLYQQRCQIEGRSARYITPITNTGSKVPRILRIQGDIEQGHWRFDPREGDQQKVIDQFCDLPGGKHDDGPDACEMADRLLRKALVGASYRDADARSAMAKREPWCTPENPAIWAGAGARA